MRTESGLSIHRVDEEQGGFHIELKTPADHDTGQNTFAVIRWDVSGRWNWDNNTLSANILSVIDSVERRYAQHRQAVEAEQRRQQQQRDQLNESFAPHWEKVVTKYGGEDDTAI